LNFNVNSLKIEIIKTILFKYFFVFFLLPTICFGQLDNSKFYTTGLTDSIAVKTYILPLFKNLKNCKNDTCRILNYRDIGYVYLDILNESKCRLYLDSALYYIGKYLLEGSNVQRFEIIKANIYNELAIFYRSVDYSLSLENNNKARIIYEKYNDLVRLRSVIANYGLIYSDLNQSDRAFQYYTEDRAIIQKLLSKDSANASFKKMSAQNFNNFGGFYMNSKDFDKAKTEYNKSLKIYLSIADTENLNFVYGNLSVAYRNMENYKMAHIFNDKVLQILKIKNYKRLLQNTYLSKAKIYFGEANYSYSLLYVKLSEDIAIKNKLNDGLRNVYEFRAKLSEKTENYKEAAIYYKKYGELKDSIYKKEALKNEFDFKEKYESKKKETEILKLTTANDIKELEITNERNAKRSFIIIAIAVSAILILVFILFIAVSVLRKKEAKANIELNKQAAQIAKYQSQMNPHFIFNALSNLQVLVIKNKVEQANQLLLSFTKLMRKTLNNSDLEYINLNEEIAFLNTYYQFEKSKVDYEIDFQIKIDEALEEENTLILPMLIQPFVENCFKHGGFNEIIKPTISVHIKKHSENRMEVKIIDNGKGLLEHHQSEEHQSKALNITKKRIELWYEKNNLETINYFELFNNFDLDKNTSGITIHLLLPLVQDF
jgi:Histidine kinase/Tetratricopeptide repeat